MKNPFKKKGKLPETIQQAWGDFDGYLDYLFGRKKADRFLTATSESFIKAYYGTVYSCIDRRSKGVAGTAWKLFTTKQTVSRAKQVTSKRKDYIFSLPSLAKVLKSATDIVEIEDDPILDLFWNTNDVQNEYQLKVGTVAYQDIEGTCYWYIIKRGTGVPDAIEFIQPQYMTAIEDKKTGKVTHYIYKAGKEEIRYEADEIVQFAYFNPSSKLKGYSPTKAACESISLERGMVDFLFDALANRLRQEVILTSEGQLQEPVIKSIQAQMESYRTTNKDKMPILPGNLKPITLSGNMRDLPFVPNRRYERESVCNVFGVPISMLSTDSSNRAVQEASEYEFAKYTLFPLCEQIQQQINQKFIPLFGDDTKFVAFDDPIPQNRELELKERETALAGNPYMTINEVRAEENLEPLPDGDILYGAGGQPIGTSEQTAKAIDEIVERIKQRGR